MKVTEKASEADKVHKAVSEKIMSGEYPAGYRLVEAELATTFNVSRTPIRLVIERLVSEGLAKHITNKGAVVRRLNIEDIQGLFAIREVNEGLAAKLASQNITPEDSEALRDMLTLMDKAIAENNLHEYYRLSGDIHHCIIKMARNEFLADFINKIYAMTYRYHIDILRLPGRLSNSFEEHRTIAEAVLSGDGERAEKTMIEHVRRIADFYSNEQNRAFFRSLSQLNW
jgi:DNA-binding GntR family transcriptional regulator